MDSQLETELFSINKGLTLTPLKKDIKIGKLNTIEHIRVELARLYRAARKAAGSEPDAATASKLAYLLNHIAKSIEGTEIERRIAELEKGLNK